MIVEPAPAKINLALHVRRRRPDGYHDIETLFAFCRDGDVVTVEAAERNRFTITGPFADLLSPPSAGGGAWSGNLVTDAADAFAACFAIDQPHAITLDKRLPIASGIGGGSADAAATLRALARLHGVASDDDRLIAIAIKLGADIPACLRSETVSGTGRGDVLVAIDGLPGMPVLLVNPGVAVSTAAVFRAWDGIDRGAISGGALLYRARAGRNDLAGPARALAPAIDAVLAMLEAAPGVSIARMSGSGATCFALFDDVAARDAAAARAAARDWWYLASSLV
ncbi:4-(cytidine 5'-diphospho)-2-C-methyl-D-erythritol kinase [Sphingomonas bacterium]|uniref:4-(cytidine 5'-diphospho)-2-C-methyl-D-erythritol kinase n=1 Tax=Sphingomonas bacterium TaxID=1895847 RepID=UPI0015765DDA|nr:4-(cytidine 5'-diphospho)-2-C-methyl-D-erythritol kinase [Sphingomonas bacterium]